MNHTILRFHRVKKIWGSPSFHFLPCRRDHLQGKLSFFSEFFEDSMTSIFPEIFQRYMTCLGTLWSTLQSLKVTGCEGKQSVFGRESQKEPGYGIFHVKRAT